LSAELVMVSDPRWMLRVPLGATQAKGYVRPADSAARSAPLVLALTSGLLRLAIEKNRARRPPFVIVNTAAPGRTRLGATAQARSVIVT
jgi:hypothetical protein